MDSNNNNKRIFEQEQERKRGKEEKEIATKINQQINGISSVFIIDFSDCACLLHGCHVFLFIVSLLSAWAYCYQVKLIKKWCGGGARHQAHSLQSTNGKKLILSFCLCRFSQLSSFHHHRYCVCMRCVDDDYYLWCI